MAFKALQNLLTSTQAYTSNVASQIVLPSAVIAALTTELSGGFYTAVSVYDGVHYEIMNITGITSGAADVTRAQDGTVAVPLAKGATVRFIWTIAGIQATSPGGAVTVAGADATAVTGGPNYTVSTDFVSVLGGTGISVTGAYPTYTITNTSVFSPITVAGTGIASVTGGPVNYNVGVVAPVFTNGTGISVTGTYPNFTIACTITGNAGTVTSLVAGNRIAITGGTPTVNPTVSVTTVGPGAGTYGGITLDAYGCITAISASVITSVSTTTSGLTIGGPTSGALTVNSASASPSQQGLTAYAPATAGGSRDSGNNTQAVTPAGVDAVIVALTPSLAPASFVVAGAQTALSSGSYTNTISGFNIAVAVAAGKYALVDVYVQSYDPSNLTVVQSLGIALFNASTLLAGVQNIIGTNKQLKYLVTGPLTATLSVKTTALVGTQVVASYYASVINN